MKPSRLPISQYAQFETRPIHGGLEAVVDDLVEFCVPKLHCDKRGAADDLRSFQGFVMIPARHSERQYPVLLATVFPNKILR
jgi:hypothetical protein